MRKRASTTADLAPQRRSEDDRQFVTALQRGLDVLRAFKPTDTAGLGNRELAARTGLPNSTISRLTFTLLKTGYLIYDANTGRYKMGVPVLSLGYACLGGIGLRERAQTYMQQLADDCGDGVLVALGGRDDMSMTYAACARSVGVISLQLNVGSRIAIGRSAMGRAYIASTGEHERIDIIQAIRNTAPVDEQRDILAGIQEARDQISARGFYANYGAWQSGVNSIAVPYLAPQNEGPLMVFNLGGPAYVLPPERLEDDLGPKLVTMVKTLGQQEP